MENVRGRSVRSVIRSLDSDQLDEIAGDERDRPLDLQTNAAAQHLSIFKVEG